MIVHGRCPPRFHKTIPLTNFEVVGDFREGADVNYQAADGRTDVNGEVRGKADLSANANRADNTPVIAGRFKRPSPHADTSQVCSVRFA